MTSSTDTWSSLYPTEEQSTWLHNCLLLHFGGFLTIDDMFDILGVHSPGYSFYGFCPSYNLQATHPDSRNREGSVLFTILITLYLSQWRFSRYTILITLNLAVHYCSLLFTILITLNLALATFKLFQND